MFYLMVTNLETSMWKNQLTVTSFLLGFEGPQSVPSDNYDFVKLFHLVWVAEMTLWNLFWGFGVFIATWETAKESVPEKAHVGVACVSGRGWGEAEWAVGGAGQAIVGEQVSLWEFRKCRLLQKMSSVRTKLSSGNRLWYVSGLGGLGLPFPQVFHSEGGGLCGAFQ